MGAVSQFSGWLNRVRYMTGGTGVQFGGARDLYTAFGYSKTPTLQDYLTTYRRQDIAKTIIDKPVKATWTDPPIVEGGKAFDDRWEELVTEGQLYHYLMKADIFAALGEWAVLVVGLDDGRSLEMPVRMGGDARKVTYLQPYLQQSVQITAYEQNTASPRFGKPTMYEITPGEVDVAKMSTHTTLQYRQKFKVHWSRVLHIANDTLENQVVGTPRLECVYNLLFDMIKTVGGSAETYWITANRGMQIDIDKELDMKPEDEENLSAEIDEYMNQLRRYIRTRGTKITNLGSDVADPRGVFEVILSLVSAATGIPKRMLVGVEAGQLASQQDRANWAVHIAERVANFAEPVMLRPAIKMFVGAGVLPEPADLKIEWPDAYKMSPLERSQTSAQMARSAANVAKALATARNEVGTPMWSIEEARRMVGFGKHMPIFEGPIPKGEEVPPEKEPEPVPTGPFGQPGKPAAPAAKPAAPKPK